MRDIVGGYQLSRLNHPECEIAPHLPLYNAKLSNPHSFIPHGGGVGDFALTNSKEAVLDSLRIGYSFIELDLIKSEGEHLIAAHDWLSLSKLTGVGETTLVKMNHNELMRLKIKGKYEMIDETVISGLLEENPDLILVLDNKDVELELLRKLIPHPDRVILEAANVQEYVKGVELGFKHIALGLYSERQLRIAIKRRIPIVTISARHSAPPENHELLRNHHLAGGVVMVYGNGVDELDFVRKNLGKICSKIYTEKWGPTNIHTIYPDTPGKQD